jgi:hypothetical protein
MGAKDSILCDEVFALDEEALVDQTCQICQQPRTLVVPHDESW